MVDPGGKSLVDTLGSQLIAEPVKDVDVPTEATTYDRMGQLIGRAIAPPTDAGERRRRRGRRHPEQPRRRRADELAGRRPSAAASLVLVVLGRSRTTRPAPRTSTAVWSPGSRPPDGVVVAGPTASATDGLLRTLRDDATLTATASSVDSDQTAAGRVVALLALDASSPTAPGQYGAEGADGAAARPASDRLTAARRVG